ncbi:MAG: glycosyltransferase [Candidatus Paceibacterota bacterium]
MLRKFIRKIRKKDVVYNITSGRTDLCNTALVYYKTGPFVSKRASRSYRHTNMWEIQEMVLLLNQLGFRVDVVDRATADFVPENKYDLFIGLTSGGSSRYFKKYAQLLTNACVIALATTTEPSVAQQRSAARYKEFTERTGIDAPVLRDFSTGFTDVNSFVDYIFCFGDEKSFSYQSYVKYGKPIYPLLPGTSPDISFSPQWLQTRKRNHFLCFAGNGFIHKGVDMVVEAFLKMPECSVTICGPDTEESFFEAYKEKIETASNITYEGFIDVGGKRFNELASECSYVVLHSSSEGCCTSVATAMRAGLVPVVNRETGVQTGDFGFLMTNDDDTIGDIVRTVRHASQISKEEYAQRVYATLEQATNYSQASFTQSFSKALLTVLGRESKFQ